MCRWWRQTHEYSKLILVFSIPAKKHIFIDVRWDEKKRRYLILADFLTTNVQEFIYRKSIQNKNNSPQILADLYCPYIYCPLLWNSSWLCFSWLQLRSTHIMPKSMAKEKETKMSVMWTWGSTMEMWFSWMQESIPTQKSPDEA